MLSHNNCEGDYSGLIFVLLSKLLGVYQPDALLSTSNQVRGMAAACGAVLLFVTSLLFLLKSGLNYSRGATIGFGFLGLGVIFALRAIIRFNLREALAKGILAGPRVIVIGEPEELAAKSALDLLRTYGTREVARFEFPQAPDHADPNFVHEAEIILPMRHSDLFVLAGVNPMNLEHVLGDIQTDRGDLHVDGSLM